MAKTATATEIKKFEEIIYNTATSNGVPRVMALLLVAQAKHETNNFSSPVFWENKNMFGYKYVKGAKYQNNAGRTSTEGDPYANYSTLENSALELVAYLKRRVADGKFPALEKITSFPQYADLLKKAGYYGDPLSVYLAGLRRWFSTDIGAKGGNIAVLFALVLLAFYLSNKT